eukprot:CAMPEP_0203964774 /NCGR_PEP_ID=MMETSP0359-20131031/94442_1 /ASSEMBLY_ACC=CAM_ASM_000338 /TAXON_ID=268821 /ORGANISM="Scrippsiella Hangoei, Strain SHTV-5" /LENGTH=40 /DNA_ID= /DNA_START= /DNA_END= /DNA_ORIENTATION=
MTDLQLKAAMPVLAPDTLLPEQRATARLGWAMRRHATALL